MRAGSAQSSRVADVLKARALERAAAEYSPERFDANAKHAERLARDSAAHSARARKAAETRKARELTMSEREREARRLVRKAAGLLGSIGRTHDPSTALYGAEHFAERARELDPSVGAQTLDNARRLREQVERAVRDGSPLPHRLERIAVELTHYQNLDREDERRNAELEAREAEQAAEDEEAFAAFAADFDAIAESAEDDAEGAVANRELEALAAYDAACATARAAWTDAIRTEHYAEGGAPFIAAHAALEATDALEAADWDRHSAKARRIVQRARRKAQREEAARERARRKAERAERKAQRAAERASRKAAREAKRAAKRAERERGYQAQAERMRERARELTVPDRAPELAVPARELTVPADAPELTVPADDPAGEDFQIWEARVADAERAFMLETSAIVAGREPDNEPTEDQSNVITLETKPNRNGNGSAPETVTTPAQVEPAPADGADIYAPVIADLERQRDEIAETLTRLRRYQANRRT